MQIITKKDDEENPWKVITYINIRVVAAELKRNVSTINRTKWNREPYKFSDGRKALCKDWPKTEKQKQRKKNQHQVVRKDEEVIFHIRAASAGNKSIRARKMSLSKFGRA